MRSLTTLSLLAALTVAAFAQTGKQFVQDFNSKLLGAKSLTVEYTIEPIGGAPEDYTVMLSKPNLVKIIAPWETVVADGQTITTYDPLGKTYYRMPDNAANISDVFADDDLKVWAGFFDPQAMENVPEALLLAQRTIAGMQLTPVKVTMDMMGAKAYTLYFDSSGMPRKSEDYTASSDSTRLMNVSKLEIGSDVQPSASFSMELPANAQELTRAEVLASRWYDNFQDAAKEAKADKKIIFLVFLSGTGALRTQIETELFPSAGFKRDSKYFVFCSIDPTTNKRMKQAYSVTATPAIFFVKPDGTRLGQVIGFPGAGQVLAQMDSARKAAGPPAP